MADTYASKFEPFKKFYVENEKLDLEALEQQDHGL